MWSALGMGGLQNALPGSNAGGLACPSLWGWGTGRATAGSTAGHSRRERHNCIKARSATGGGETKQGKGRSGPTLLAASASWGSTSGRKERYHTKYCAVQTCSQGGGHGGAAARVCMGFAFGGRVGTQTEVAPEVAARAVAEPAAAEGWSAALRMLATSPRMQQQQHAPRHGGAHLVEGHEHHRLQQEAEWEVCRAGPAHRCLQHSLRQREGPTVGAAGVHVHSKAGVRRQRAASGARGQGVRSRAGVRGLRLWSKEGRQRGCAAKHGAGG